MQDIMSLRVSLFFLEKRMARMMKDSKGKPMTWKDHAFVKDADEQKKKKPKKTIQYPPPKKKKKKTAVKKIRAY